MTEAAATGKGHSTASFVLRLLVPVGALAGAFALVVVLVGERPPRDTSTLLLRVLVGVVLSLLVLAAASVCCRAVGRSLPVVGLHPPRDAWRALLAGALAWGLPAAGGLAALAWAGGGVRLVGGPADVALVVLLVVLAVVVGEAFPEELVFRGLVTDVLGERLRGWGVVLAQTGLFTAVAVALRGGVGAADVSLFVGMGVGLGYLRMVTGSVWTTVGFHAAFQSVSQLVLTHDVVTVDAAPATVLVVLGAVPFGVGAVLVTWWATTWPQLFARREP